MKRPILIITIGYLLGIIFRLYLFKSIAFYIGILIGIIVYIKFINKKIKRYLKLIVFKNIGVIFGVSLLFGIISTSFYNYKFDNLYNGIEKCDGIVVIEQKIENKEKYNRYLAKVESINNKKKFKNTSIYFNVDKELEYGDKISFNGEFIKPQVQRNYGGFDYALQLKSKKVYGTINAEKCVKVGNDSLNILEKIVDKVRNVFIKRIDKAKLDEETSSFLKGILLGNNKEISNEIKESFQKSNLSHILAISGLHIGIVVAGIKYVLKLINVSNRNSKKVVILFLIFFVYLVGKSVSVQRAALMFILSISASLLFRKSDTLNNISLAFFLNIIFNPFSIFDIGLQLSYGATLGIVLFNKLLFSRGLFENNKLLKHFKDIIKVSISAFIIILPILIYNYNLVSFLFIVSSILTSDLIGVLIIIGYIAIIFDFKPFFSICSLIIQFLNKISSIISNIPILNFKIITPNLFIIILYYLVCYLLFILLKVKKGEEVTIIDNYILDKYQDYKSIIKKYYKKVFIFSFIVILLIFIILRVERNLEIHFIDVGQGDCTLIITPNNKKILIDGGGSVDENYDIGKQVLVPYLLDRGITKLDYVVVSHFDNDHCRRYFNFA